MKILNFLKPPPSKPYVVGLGNFDGVHLGHQHILKTVVQKAKNFAATPICLTFDPHPKVVLSPQKKDFFFITTLDQKIHFIKKMGIQCVCLIPFTKILAQWSAEKFTQNLFFQSPQLKTLVVGFNFRFGFQRTGTVDLLQNALLKKKIPLIVSSPVTMKNTVVSSTHVRNLLRKGDMKTVQHLLGRFFSISGSVKHGKHRGRSLGFPTANLEIEQGQLLSCGVYCVFVHTDNSSHCGIMNVGRRPTFKEEADLLYEVHLFDFTGDLYGRRLCVDIVEKLRNECSFTSTHDLRHQIKDDCQQCRNILQSQQPQEFFPHNF